jgi:hypothetical protein
MIKTILPNGWIPLTIAFDGDAEEVAYGTPEQMNRLKKWLDKYYSYVLAEKNGKSQDARSQNIARTQGLQMTKTITYDDSKWKLVPIEPTKEMQTAGAQAIRIETTILNKIWTGNAVFRSMVEVAPQLAQQPAQAAAPQKEGE